MSISATRDGGPVYRLSPTVTARMIRKLCSYTKDPYLNELEIMLASTPMANFNFAINEIDSSTSFVTCALKSQNIEAMRILVKDLRISIHQLDVSHAWNISPEFACLLLGSSQYIRGENCAPNFADNLEKAILSMNHLCTVTVLTQLMLLPPHTNFNWVITSVMKKFDLYLSNRPDIIAFEDWRCPFWVLECLFTAPKTFSNQRFGVTSQMLDPLPHHLLRKICKTQLVYLETDGAMQNRVKLGYYYYLIALMFSPTMAESTGLSDDLLGYISDFVFYVDVKEDGTKIWNYIKRLRQTAKPV